MIVLWLQQHSTKSPKNAKITCLLPNLIQDLRNVQKMHFWKIKLFKENFSPSRLYQVISHYFMNQLNSVKCTTWKLYTKKLKLGNNLKHQSKILTVGSFYDFVIIVKRGWNWNSFWITLKHNDIDWILSGLKSLKIRSLKLRSIASHSWID